MSRQNRVYPQTQETEGMENLNKDVKENPQVYDHQSRNNTMNMSSLKGRTADLIKDPQYFKADFLKALEYKKNNQITDVEGKEYPLCVELDEFSRFGVGIKVFFQFLRYLMIVFIIMSIISSLSLYSNWSGRGLVQVFGSQASTLAKLTLANQPVLLLVVPLKNNTSEQKALIQQQNENSMNSYVDEINKRQFWITIPDILNCLIFFIFIIIWQSKIKDIRIQLQKQCTPSKYAIIVEGYSPDIINNNDIKNHFEYFGKVIEVQHIRNFHGSLFIHKATAKLISQIQKEKIRNKIRAETKYKKLSILRSKLKIEKKQNEKIVSKRIGHTVESHDKFPSLGAIVVFNSEQERQKVLTIYNKARYSYMCSEIPQHLKINGTDFPHLISEVEEPSNINWENQDVSYFERFWRVLFVLVTTLLIMLLTVIIIVIGNLISPLDDFENCPKNEITLLDVENSKLQYPNTTDYLKSCFCMKQPIDLIKSDPSINQMCSSVYKSYILSVFFQFFIAGVIIIVNIILEYFQRKLVVFSKFKTKSGETIGMSNILFISMFINTSILTVLFQANIYGNVIPLEILKPVPFLLDLQQQKQFTFSPDFDRAWYIKVGNYLQTTYLIQLIFPHLLSLLILPIIRYLREKNANKAVLQIDMNKYIIGRSFDLSFCYSLVMNTVFNTMIYSAGMPLQFMVGCIAIILQYWCFKYMMLRFNKNPVINDIALNQNAIRMLPYALILHLLMSIYMYSNPIIFPENTNELRNVVNKNLYQQGINQVSFGTQGLNDIKKRLMVQVEFSILLAIVVIYHFFIEKFLEYWHQDEKVMYGTYEEEYQNMSERMLASYNIENNQNYAQLVQAFNSAETLKKTMLNTLEHEHTETIFQKVLQDHIMVIENLDVPTENQDSNKLSARPLIENNDVIDHSDLQKEQLQISMKNHEKEQSKSLIKENQREIEEFQDDLNEQKQQHHEQSQTQIYEHQKSKKNSIQNNDIQVDIPKSDSEVQKLNSEQQQVQQQLENSIKIDSNGSDNQLKNENNDQLVDN